MSRLRPDSESAPANRLTPALRARFVTLLRPSPRKIGGRVQQIFEALKVEADQSQHLKELYEDRTFGERKEQLEILLGVLASDKRVDLKATVEVLETAAWAQHQAFRSGQQFDQVRNFKEQRERLKEEVRDLRKRLRAFYSSLAHEVHFHVELGFQDDGPRDGAALFAALERLDAAIETDPVMTLAVPERMRREKRGQPPQPWLKAAQDGLRRAGIRQTERTHLLRLVDLLPYRSN